MGLCPRCCTPPCTGTLNITTGGCNIAGINVTVTSSGGAVVDFYSVSATPGTHTVTLPADTYTITNDGCYSTQTGVVTCAHATNVTLPSSTNVTINVGPLCTLTGLGINNILQVDPDGTNGTCRVTSGTLTVIGLGRTGSYTVTMVTHLGGCPATVLPFTISACGDHATVNFS